jgi:hypothetical protein
MRWQPTVPVRWQACMPPPLPLHASRRCIVATLERRVALRPPPPPTTTLHALSACG